MYLLPVGEEEEVWDGDDELQNLLVSDEVGERRLRHEADAEQEVVDDGEGRSIGGADQLHAWGSGGRAGEGERRRGERGEGEQG